MLRFDSRAIYSTSILFTMSKFLFDSDLLSTFGGRLLDDAYSTINGSSSVRAILTKLKHSYLHNCFICKWHWNEWKIKTRHILIDSILGLCTLHSLKQNKIHLKIVKWVILVAKMTSNIENNAKIYKFTISISRQFAFELFAYWQVVVIVVDVVVVVGFFLLSNE